MHECRRSFLLSEPEYRQAALLDTHDKGREIAVARHQGESVDVFAVQQVHRIDDHGGVRGVLVVRVRKLLERTYRVGTELLYPAIQIAALPISMGMPDVDGAMLGEFGKTPSNA